MVLLLSKLSLAKAGDILGILSGANIRRIRHAISVTARVMLDALDRVAQSTLAQIDEWPKRIDPRDLTKALRPISQKDPLVSQVCVKTLGFAEAVAFAAENILARIVDFFT